MVATGDQHVRFASIIYRSVPAYLERENLSAFETGSQLGIARQIWMRIGKRLELGERLLIAVELSFGKRNADRARRLAFCAATRVEVLTREKPRRDIGKVFRGIEACQLISAPRVLVGYVSID